MPWKIIEIAGAVLDDDLLRGDALERPEEGQIF
jgi:hypothetical protein